MHSSGYAVQRVVFWTILWGGLQCWAHVADATALSCPTASVGGANIPITANTNPPLPGAVTPTSPRPRPGDGPQAPAVTRPPATDPGKTEAGGYDPTKDPGMGGKPPDIAGATQAGAPRAGGGRSPDDKGDTSSQGLGGGEVTRIPPVEPPPSTDAPSGGREPQPVPGGGWRCYSASTQEWYQVPMGPCPPPSWKPPRGPSPEDPGVRVPHDTLQPGSGMGDKPGGKPGKPMGPGTSPSPAAPSAGKSGQPTGPACGPMTSCTCKGGGKGHIPCDKSKGACHCGAG
jgi:hypothetical protein